MQERRLNSTPQNTSMHWADTCMHKQLIAIPQEYLQVPSQLLQEGDRCTGSDIVIKVLRRRSESTELYDTVPTFFKFTGIC